MPLGHHPSTIYPRIGRTYLGPPPELQGLVTTNLAKQGFEPREPGNGIKIIRINELIHVRARPHAVPHAESQQGTDRIGLPAPDLEGEMHGLGLVHQPAPHRVGVLP
jgi:hypothetical protein